MITTTKARSPLLSQPDEMQAAYNAFATAVKHFTESPTYENQLAVDTAQKEVYRVEDLYRQGRNLKLNAARRLAPQWKQ